MAAHFVNEGSVPPCREVSPRVAERGASRVMRALVAMTDDEKREHAIEACRTAITAWIESDGHDGARQLRDSLHALSVCRPAPRNLTMRGMPGRARKAA